MGLSIRGIVLLLCLAVPVLVAAKPSSWKQYRSSHFVLYSDRNSSEAVELLQQFERFRYAALMLTGSDLEHAEEPATIVMFKHKHDFRAVQPDSDIAGFYRDGWAGPEMVVGADVRLRDVSLILFHEYVHFLVRERSPRRYPVWYDEGFADLLAASHVADDHVLVGLVHPWRQKTLLADGVLPLRQLLHRESTHDKLDSQFYASAWLLMHYLQLGHLSGEPKRLDALAGYLRALDEGELPPRAFARHFGVTIEQAQEKLQKYSERPLWSGYRLKVPAGKHKVRRRTLSINEAAFLLGGIAYRGSQAQAALEYLQRINAKEKSAAAALSLRAIIEGHLGRQDLAEHVLGYALRNDRKNSTVLSNAAHLHWDLAQTEDLSAAKRERHLRKAGDYARAALESDGDNIEAVRYLAAVHGAEGEIEQAIELLAQHAQTHNSDLRLNLELASYLAESKQPNRALPYLQRVLQWDHSTKRRRQAQALMQAIAPTAHPQQKSQRPDAVAPVRIGPNH